jgi:folate-binding protein YgfZ
VISVALDGQYRALREEAGMAWRDLRLVTVAGPDGAEYLQGQLTNDIEALGPGDGCYSALLDRKGHMQADMRVLRIAPDLIWLQLEPEALDAAARHLTMYSVGRDVTVSGESEVRTLSLAGPAAAERSGLPPLGAEHAHTETAVDGIECRAVRTDAGLDLLVEPASADELAAALAARGVAEVEDDALEILRVESGRPRFGREMTTATIPQEAGINERAVSFTKGCYIGQETVARLHYRGKPNRHLLGLRLSGSVTTGSVVKAGERELGTVGTAVLSPAHGPIALAILRRETGPGATVDVEDAESGEVVKAEVVEPPFAAHADA